MSGHYVTFAALPVGAYFVCNGCRCIKRSKTTATLSDYNRVFYFGQRDLCTIGWPEMGA